MQYIRHLLKRYPVSSFYIFIIWVLCFATVPHTPLDNVTLIDKWVHTAMYLGTCGTIWYEYLHQHRVKCDIGGGYRYDINPLKLFLLAWLAKSLSIHSLPLVQAMQAKTVLGD